MTDLIPINAAARIARACCGVGKPELIEQYLLAGTPAYIVEAEMVSAEAAPAPAPAAPDATMTGVPAGCRTQVRRSSRAMIRAADVRPLVNGSVLCPRPGPACNSGASRFSRAIR